MLFDRRQACERVMRGMQKTSSIGARISALVIIGCAIVPAVIIGAIARISAASLKPMLPRGVDLDIAASLRHIFHLYKWEGDDSWAPMQRALQLLHGPAGQRLYETIFFQEHLRFQYPVTSLLPLELLNKAGLGSVLALNTINLGLLLANAVAVGVLAHLISSSQVFITRSGWSSRARRFFAISAGLLSLAFYPLIRAGVLGQIQVWIDLLFTCVLICWVLDKKFSAGLLLGLVAAIKPQFGLLLLWAMLWREWRFAFGFLASAGTFAAIALALYGVHNNIAYLTVLSFLANHGENYFANNSVNGILNWYFSGMDSLRWDSVKLPPHNLVVYVGTALSSAVFLTAVVLPPILNRFHGASLTYLGAAAICTVVSSPVAWEHHYGILLPLYLIAIRNGFGAPSSHLKTWLFWAIFASWILVSNFNPFLLLLARTHFAFAMANCFLGGLVLLGVLFITARMAERGGTA